jgi:hypothetical protein
VLTDYLAAKPSDGGMEGRFKSAVESVFTGTAVEGVVLGARALRAARSVGGARQSELTMLREKYGELDNASFTKTIGDPSKPMIETVVKQPPSAASVAAGKVKAGAKATDGATADDLVGGRALIDAGESQVYVNFSRIDGPDKVKALIGEMATKFSGSIDEAARGTMSQADNVRDTALSTVGWAYVFGFSGPGKLDCSGEVYYSMRQNGGRTRLRFWPKIVARLLPAHSRSGFSRLTANVISVSTLSTPRRANRAIRFG